MGSNRLMALGVLIMAVGLILSLIPYTPLVQNGGNSQASYSLTLVIAPKTAGNTSDYAFFVVVNGIKMTSSAINVPSNVSVEITIANQDSGTDPLLSSHANSVSGTDDGYMSLAGSSLQATPGTGEAPGGHVSEVSSIAVSDISHTFTTDNGLNIPIPPLSTVYANATFSTPGLYSWGCLCQCGPASMNTTGWMYGAFIVS